MGQAKFLSILLYVVMGISALLGIVFYAGGVSENTLLIWAYILLAATAAIAVIGPVILFAQNPAKAKSSLIGIGALVVIFGIAYAFASGDISSAVYSKFEVTESASKQVGSLIIGTYILGIITIGIAIVSSLLNAFKK